MAKPSRRIKLSKNLRPFVSRVVRNGKAQKQFTENVGKPMVSCIRSEGGYREGITPGERVRIFNGCARRLFR